jgi:hypothetical protein
MAEVDIANGVEDNEKEMDRSQDAEHGLIRDARLLFLGLGDDTLGEGAPHTAPRTRRSSALP